MNTTFGIPRWVKTTIGLVMATAGILSSQAALVYDNSANPLTNSAGVRLVHYYNQEFGDEIVLAGSERLVTGIFFDYWGDFAPSLDNFGRLRFYANDGPDLDPRPNVTALTPGTLLYDSGHFLLSTNYQLKVILNIGVVVPDSFTWTVEFTGVSLEPGDRAGLLFYHPPTIGGSARDFWARIDGTWRILHFGGSTFKPEANFGIKVVAVPEPTVLALAALGGICLLRRRRG